MLSSSPSVILRKRSDRRILPQGKLREGSHPAEVASAPLVPRNDRGVVSFFTLTLILSHQGERGFGCGNSYGCPIEKKQSLVLWQVRYLGRRFFV